MSYQKHIIEIVPPGYQRIHETLQFRGYVCPECKGRGGFNQEVCHNEYKTIPCDYCDGTGYLQAEVHIRWKPDME